MRVADTGLFPDLKFLRPRLQPLRQFPAVKRFKVKIPTLSQKTQEGWGTRESDKQQSRENPMCPACITSAALMAGSVMSTGGIAALAVKLVRSKKNGPDDNSQQETERSHDHGNDDK